MKSISKNIFGILAASLLLSLTSCSDDSLLDKENANDEAQNIVTFYVAPYAVTSASPRSRASEDQDAAKTDDEWKRLERETIDDPGPSIFGNGSQVDMLAFAVYKKNSQGVFELQSEFQKNDTKVGVITPGEGQNLISVSQDEWPVEIKLAIDAEATYKVVFWAQNSRSSAYDISNFERVEAFYTNAPNNDESRDAFSAVKEISGYQTKPVEVILHRTVAQINVGTTGWDYEGAAVLRPTNVSYARSQITLKGVPKYFDALNERAISNDPETGLDLTTNVTFGYSRIPAFANLTDEQWDNLDYKLNPNEELLYVNLYTDDSHPDYNGDKFYTYKPWDAFIAYRNNHEDSFYNEGDRPLTEAFKYLSMCYVFAPNGGVINEVKFEALGKTDKDGIGEVFTVNNVPVQKNWRTNLIGDSFFVETYKYYVAIVPTFCGDYDNIDDAWQNNIKFDEEGNLNPYDEEGNKLGIGNPNQGFIDKWGEDYYGTAADEDEDED